MLVPCISREVTKEASSMSLSCLSTTSSTMSSIWLGISFSPMILFLMKLRDLGLSAGTTWTEEPSERARCVPTSL